MSIKKKIDGYLRAAPKPPPPDGLLDRLQKDISIEGTKTQRSALSRWFAPAGGPVSLWRVAAAIAIAILVLLPLSYVATKVIKHFTVIEVLDTTFEFPEYNVGFGAKAVIASSDPNFTEEDAQKIQEEFRKLYEEGKAREVEPGVWEVTLSDGSVFGGNMDPELVGLSQAEQRKALKRRFDEINELRKAGKFERTYGEVVEINEALHRLYEDRFTLSNGQETRMGGAEPIAGTDEEDYEY